MWKSAKGRAKKKGLEFAIPLEDIVIPDVCPVLDIPLSKQKGNFGPNSPSLDRIRIADGYILGNIAVISWRANSLKKNGTAEELEKVAAYLRKHETNREAMKCST